eukprot:scaffold9391_cov39-Cyclotella_meneghiniana.AAC.9
MQYVPLHLVTAETERNKAQLQEKHSSTEIGRSDGGKHTPNPSVSPMTSGSRIKVFSAFTVALRQGRFSGPSHDSLAESTIQSTVLYAAQAFRENDKPNPTRDHDGELMMG